MNDIRAKFEEIWPVPEGVAWSMNVGCYVCNDAVRMTQERINKCIEWDARLDTFTRCQETTDVYVSLVRELINELDEIAGWVEAGRADGDDVIRATRLTDRAKQIMGDKK